MAKAWGILDFDSLFNVFLWNWSIFSFHLSISFRIFQVAFSLFWQSYFQLPRFGQLFSEKKYPMEPKNNSEKEKKDAHSNWNEKIDQLNKNTNLIMNQNLKSPMPLPHKMCLVAKIIYHLPLVVGGLCKNKKK